MADVKVPAAISLRELNWEGKQQHTITSPLGIFPKEMQEMETTVKM